MKTVTLPVLSILVVVSGQAFAQDTPKAAKEAGRPGAILSDSECAKIWNDAAGRGDLSAQQAKPYVTNFEQVDKNSDNKISNAEFKEGCKMGFVQHASAGSDSSSGSSPGVEGSE